MAKTGNHGQIIPRDAELLRDLYWRQNKTLPEIGSLFGVNHKSVERVFRLLGIPRRSKGASRHDRCIECGEPVHKIKHAGNGSAYGRLCKTHWNEHRAALARAEAATPDGTARRKRLWNRWYYEGPLNPEGESQWLSKGRALLRRAKRTMATREVS